MPATSELTALRNIGKQVAHRLNGIGIHTPADLERVGPSAAYRQLRARHPDTTLPRRYYLYSLEGALRDIHWDALSDADKQRLSDASGFEG